MSLRASRADRSDRVGIRRLEHRGEPGDALDDLLEDDVGLVDADLRASDRREVVDLHDERGPRRGRWIGAAGR